MSHVPEILCDECGAVADAVHLLPWVTDCERVAFSCSAHDFGGYWFLLEHLWPAEHVQCTAAHVVGTKRNGYRTLARVFDRIAEFAEREDARLAAATRRLAIERGEVDRDGEVTFVSLRTLIDAGHELKREGGS